MLLETEFGSLDYKVGGEHYGVGSVKIATPAAFFFGISSKFNLLICQPIEFLATAF